MRTIVIPDIHTQQQYAERILTKDKPWDKAIFLGDYFDAFFDTPTKNRDTALWLKESLKDEKRIHLIGNHDINYHPINHTLTCSGYSYDKCQAIREVFGEIALWNKLKWHVYEQGWLLTHAGLHEDLIPFPKQDEEAVDLWLTKEGKTANENLEKGLPHWFWHAGEARGGIGTGGILWCDANQEFVGSQQLRQIFGHTYQKDCPIWQRGDSGLERFKSKKFKPNKKENWNLALDCSLKYYAVIDDGVVSIIKAF